MQNANTKSQPEIIDGVVVEPNPQQWPTLADRAPITPPFVLQPQDVPPLVSLVVGVAIYEGIRWALWRYFDHLSDS